MPDEETLGEVSRNVARLERRVESGQKDTDDRIADLASKMVPTTLWAAQHEALERTVAEVRSDMTAGFERVERTSQERKGVLERTDAEMQAAITALRKSQSEHARAHQQAEKDAAAWSRKKTMAVIGIIVGAIATVAGAWIAAVMAAGGVH